MKISYYILIGVYIYAVLERIPNRYSFKILHMEGMPSLLVAIVVSIAGAFSIHQHAL